jgi:hypothetical protein
MMVDYTDFEEERLREKSFCMFPHYITCGPPQRRREEVLREILIIIFRGGGGIYKKYKFFIRIIEGCYNE